MRKNILLYANQCTREGVYSWQKTKTSYRQHRNVLYTNALLILFETNVVMPALSWWEALISTNGTTLWVGFWRAEEGGGVAWQTRDAAKSTACSVTARVRRNDWKAATSSTLYMWRSRAEHLKQEQAATGATLECSCSLWGNQISSCVACFSILYTSTIQNTCLVTNIPAKTQQLSAALPLSSKGKNPLTCYLWTSHCPQKRVE